MTIEKHFLVLYLSLLHRGNGIQSYLQMKGEFA